MLKHRGFAMLPTRCWILSLGVVCAVTVQANDIELASGAKVSTDELPSPAYGTGKWTSWPNKPQAGVEP